MLNNKFLFGTIALVFVLFFYNIFELFEIYRQREFIKKVDNNIAQIIKSEDELNKEIDYRLLFVGYDRVLLEIKQYKEQIEKLSKLLNNDKKLSNSLLELENKFKKKVNLIERYNRERSSLILELHSLNSSSFSDKPMIYKFENELFYKGFYDNGAREVIKSQIENSPNLSDEVKDKFKNSFYMLKSARELSIEARSATNSALSLLQESWRETVEKLNSQSKNRAITMALLIFIVLISSLYAFFNYIKIQTLLKVFKESLDRDFSTIIITNSKFKAIFANKKLYQKGGKTAQGKHLFELLNFKDGKQFLENVINSLSKNRELSLSALSIIEENKESYVDLYAFPIAVGAIRFYGFILVDRTDKKEIEDRLVTKEDELYNIAFIDSLTGVKNRSALVNLMKKEPSGAMIVLIYLESFSNLRFFYKRDFVNENFTQICGTIKLAIKTHNIDAELFVLSIDEFGLWYKGSDILRDIELINRYFEARPKNLLYQGYYQAIAQTTLIYGISSKSDGKIDRLNQADIAKFEALKYKKKISLYRDNNDVEQLFYKNQQIIDFLQNAIAKKRVFFEYQAIFDLNDIDENLKFRPYSYEVLLRAIDENGKIVYPNSFLDVAKRTFLYNYLTRDMIDTVFKIMTRFKNMKFNINISSQDLLNLEIRELLLDKVSNSKEARNLTIEILESDKIDDYDFITPFLKQLKGYGCKIAIDDFGSGYSNYYRMLTLDIDIIKIDGDIIKNITKDSAAKELVQTIVYFAKRQGYGVVAEYVSTPEILQEVRQMGINYAQGFLLQRPVSLNYIETY